MNQQLIDEFRNPGPQYRGAPFWAWNGRLEPAELRRQIRIMHRMGLGGFFMHSRVGLNTPYLSDEWFECVEACVDEAEKLGMQAWLYDEDRWPSGAAGGLVTKNPRYRHRALVMTISDNAADVKWTGETLAVFTGELRDGSVFGLERAASGARPRLTGTRKAFMFTAETDPCSSWYNGRTYLDTMNPAAVRQFIKVTHEAYRKHVGARFGRRIPGIFTDEPNYMPGSFRRRPGKLSRPWTGRLTKVFRKRYGYDITDHLVEIFYNIEGRQLSNARRHYYDCVTHLFVDAFARQIGNWCARHNLQFTGHMLAEETLSSQADVVGAAMRSYEYMQTPGMDILTEHRREYDTAKMVSSVARQFGRKWRLTETYGCTGWDFPFLGHKAIGDWQAALGINLRCQHLAWYTMEGQAKRDYPAGIFYQSPWWRHYSKVENYFARINAVMTRGIEVRDLLVIHPIESMWMLFGAENAREKAEYDLVIADLRDSLLAANLDFDYGDEDIMARHARVVRKGGRPLLRVGKADYTTVIVPPSHTIRGSTLSLLKRFRVSGGAVVFAGNPPEHVDGEPDTAAARFAELCRRAPAKGKRLAKTVEESARRISVADAAGNEIGPVLYLLREDKDAYYLFICNTGHSPAQLKRGFDDPSMIRDRKTAFPDVHVTGFAGCRGKPVELDPDTGAIYTATTGRKGKDIDIVTSLPPLGSRLFAIPKRSAKRETGYRARPRYKVVNERTMAGKWDIALSESNCLVLDRPEYRIGNEAWMKPAEILRIDTAVRNALSLQRRGGQMTQPWARQAGPERDIVSTPVALGYDFRVDTVPDGEFYLAIERPDLFAISINGTDLDTDTECGWWCDRSLRKVPADPALLRRGTNRILLECGYNGAHPGLEIVYLLGNFGVRLNGMSAVLVPAPAALKPGDWARQGLPFYSGSVTYKRAISPRLGRGERLFVRVPEYKCAAVRVVVDGVEAGIIAWEPNELDITEWARNKPGAIDLRLEALGHRRNSHGPLHHAARWPKWTGPGEYVSSGDRWQDTYGLVPCGIMKSPQLIRAVRG